VRETAVTGADDATTDDSDGTPTARPVTILTGSLGAGKTTTLNHLLANSDQDIAVLVNDMGSLNVDAELVDVETTLEGGESRMAELSNGCICCGLQGELRNELFQLAESYEFDHLVIEASGISEPKPIAGQLVGGGAVGDRYDLGSIVSVVDTPRFAATFGDAVPERAGTDGEGRKPLSDLAIEQVEFCTTIIANKQDLVDNETADRAERLLKSLQPEATIHRATAGQVDPAVVLAETFDPETVNKSASWKQALEAAEDDDHEHADSGDDHGDGEHDHGHDHDHEEHNHEDHGHDRHDHEDHGHDRHDHDDHGYDHHDHDDHDHVHPPELYGVDSVTYRRRRPFHPKRFDAWLESVPEGVVRAKGIVWIAGRESQALTVSIVGRRSTVEVTGQWIASLPEGLREKYRRAQPEMAWDDKHGDREIRLALLGSDLDDSVISGLDDALVTDEEWAEGVGSVKNPFPQIESEQYQQGPEAPEPYR